MPNAAETRVGNLWSWHIGAIIRQAIARQRTSQSVNPYRRWRASRDSLRPQPAEPDPGHSYFGLTQGSVRLIFGHRLLLYLWAHFHDR